MKTKRVYAALLLTTGVSGIAIACGAMLPLPIPPVPVPISQLDLGQAAFAGFSDNAGYAAAMKKLDALGRAAMGDSAWRANSYGGMFAYSVTLLGVTGVNSIYVEKGCDQTFLDNVPHTGGGGGGGGIGGIGEGCNSGGQDYGIIGYTVISVPWTVCSPFECSSGTYYEYSAQYGQIAGDC
jgi:hypothetical protein